MLNMPVGDVKKKIQEQAGLTQEQIEERIQEKMRQLAGLISEEGACHIIANELNVQLVPAPKDRTVKDLLPGMRDVQQDLRVIQVYELRTFKSKFSDGEGKVASFLGGDPTGVIRVTCWGDLADKAASLKPQQVVRVKNGYVKDNNGRAELHLNDKSTLEADPKGVTVETAGRRENAEYARRRVNELSQGDFRVELLGTVVQVYDPRFFTRKDGTDGAVVNVLLDDGTGNVRIGCFDAQAATALGLELEKLLERKEGSFDEEKTALLGNIVKVRGRAKLNTVYNSIELTADSLETAPDAAEELERLGVQDAPKERDSEPEDIVTVEEDVEVEEDAVSLDDLEDIDLDDLDTP